ncbi:MAG TPA: EutN/CcmL family microcompartment protein [Candidatus Sumerlaeota bacterium]|nr:EutN/CcmL family microcompartment protein [Candidatus Sumerlaeota bacterium]
MILGMVVGNVVSTQKDAGLTGFKLLVVQQVGLDMQLKPSYLIAADAVGSGLNEVVIVVQGSSARIAEGSKNKPVDASVIAIVDTMEVEGRRVYQKFQNS